MTSVSVTEEGVRLYAGPPDRAMVLRLGWGEVAALVEERGALVPENQQQAGLRPLSRREAEVARAAVEGLSMKETAQRLGLSARTVGAYLAALYRKLGIHNRAMLAQWGRENLAKLETPNA